MPAEEIQPRKTPRPRIGASLVRGLLLVADPEGARWLGRHEFGFVATTTGGHFRDRPNKRRRRQQGQEICTVDRQAGVCVPAAASSGDYQLGYEEALFLVRAGHISLACRPHTQPAGSGDDALSDDACWRRLCELRRNLPHTYAAYCHWRERGWVPRCGLR